MLRQLSFLTRPVEALDADAIAVYGRADGLSWVPTPASDQGFEGVACVDDAARALHLYCVLLRCGARPGLRLAADRLLRFVCAMRGADGTFHNFLLDWSGGLNRTGPTSYAGGPYWTGRAIRALVDAYTELGSPDCRKLACEAIEAISGGQVLDRLDALATLIQALVALWQSTRDTSLATLARAYADRIADCRLGDALLDEASATDVHLWAHEQELALVRTGQMLDLRSLVQVAARSAETVLRPPAEEGFRRPSTCPYEVSCVARGLMEVGRASGRQHLVDAASRARGWFHGRNPASTPVYDAKRRAFLDGIDHDRVNPDSGAESNVEGALCFVTVR